MLITLGRIGLITMLIIVVRGRNRNAITVDTNRNTERTQRFESLIATGLGV